MATITPALLTALMTGFKANFEGGLSLITPTYPKIATTIPSSTRSNTYGWLGQMPAFREWIGDRVLENIQSHGYAINNKKWSMGIEVPRDDIEDDNLGIYATMFTGMGEATALHPDELVYGLLKAGHTTNCYDGQFFFDTDHPVNSKHDGSGTATPTSNLTAGTGAAWYLLDTSRSIKPLIFQARRPSAFSHMTAKDDESVFMRDSYRYGVDGRYNVGFGFWQMAHKSQAALTGASLNDAINKMMLLKSDGGRYLNIRPTLLVVPPTLREAALEITQAERNAAGATNINRNVVDVLVTPMISA